jgi:hypothetical protein
MVYAIVVDQGTIDSPDVPAYQPHVYDRLDLCTLIPLQMREVDLRVDVAVMRTEVTLRARWWVHCIAQSRIEQHLLCTAFFPSPVLKACHRLSECLHRH